MPNNAWGPFFPQSAFEYPVDGGQPSAPAIPPQSPSGSVTGESAEFNFNETITSTEQILANELQVESSQQGTPALNAPAPYSGQGPNQGYVRWE